MINEETLKEYLINGMSSRDIEKITGINYWNITALIKKYNISEFNKYRKAIYRNDFFNKIDSKEKAYILGFILGDSCLTTDDKLDIRISKNDIEILKFIQKNLGGKVNVSNKKDIKKRIFPSANIKIGENTIIKNIKMLFGGRLKEERHIPIIKKELEKFLLQGFFDAEGCVTWGYRKDRGRLWHKINFTSQYKMLEGIQNILIKNNISTKIRPKSKENCFVMELGGKNDILKLLNLIYSDENFIVLKRKYKKSNALRLELGDIGESL